MQFQGFGGKVPGNYLSKCQLISQINTVQLILNGEKIDKKDSANYLHKIAIGKLNGDITSVQKPPSAEFANLPLLTDQISFSTS